MILKTKKSEKIRKFSKLFRIFLFLLSYILRNLMSIMNAKLHLKLLVLIARFGVVSRKQLYKYFDKKDHTAVRDHLSTKHFRDELVSIPALNSRGEYQDEQLTIYYLSNSGRYFVNKNLSKAVKVLPKGTPLIARRNRIYHELLVFECYLYWCRKYTDIEYLTENELKSRGENPADLRIIRYENGEKIENDCEIIVTNQRAQIAAKANNMLFFTPSLQKKDLIDRAKKTESILLNLETNKQKRLAVERLLTRIEFNIIRIIVGYGGILNACALALLTGKDRGYITSVANKLVADKFMYAATIQSGIKKSNKIYAAEEVDLIAFSERMFGLLLSKSIQELAENNVIKYINREDRVMVTDNGFARRVYYFDNGDTSIRQEAKRLAEIKAEAARLRIGYLFVAADYERFKQMRLEYKEYFCYAFDTQSSIPLKFRTQFLNPRAV